MLTDCVDLSSLSPAAPGKLGVIEPALIDAQDFLTIWKGLKHELTVLHTQKSAPRRVGLKRYFFEGSIPHSEILSKNAADILLGHPDAMLWLDYILDLLGHHKALFSL